MKCLIALAFVLSLGTVAQASTDFTCVDQCTKQGNVYNLCYAKCSYGNQPQAEQQRARSTDFSCVSRCTDAGAQYGLCLERCSY